MSGAGHCCGMGILAATAAVTLLAAAAVALTAIRHGTGEARAGHYLAAAVLCGVTAAAHAARGGVPFALAWALIGSGAMLFYLRRRRDAVS